MRDQIEDAICSVEDFQAPFAAVAGNVFVGLGELVAHEVLRDRGDLYFFDALADVQAEQHSGTVFVFLSHQWLGHFNPDPQGIHYRAMVRAVTSTAERASVPLNRVRVWVDFASVPHGTPSPNTPGRRSRRLSRAASSGSTEPSTPAVTVDDSAPTSPV